MLRRATTSGSEPDPAAAAARLRQRRRTAVRRGGFQHLSADDIISPADGNPSLKAAARKTSIVCAIGPASRSKPVLRRLLDAGMPRLLLNI